VISKKNYYICFFLTLFLFPCFASNGHTGILAGEKDLKIVQTKYFDIIYPLQCEQTASILFENADSLYEEIISDYSELTVPIKMPIVISPANEVFNAYWTDAPYNHLVIYDTAVLEDLSVFSQTILSTVKHELTHAVTYNLRSDFVKSLDKIFGDWLSLQFWITSRGMGEGAAVAQESKTEEGRLNDEFAMHQVKQAKIENKFPKYLDVQNITDYYPNGLCYYFNAAFTKWIQEKYGMQKYADFWFTCLNMQKLTLNGAFKSVYGANQDDLWQEFINAFYVPQIPANPVEADFANYIFGKKENSIGRHFSSLTACNSGFAYIDSSCDSVFYADWNTLENNKKSAKKLFTLTNIDKINFSQNGQFLIATYYSTNYSNIKQKIRIYDIENSSFFEVDETGLRDGTIFSSDEKLYLACQKFSSQNYSIRIYELEQKIKSNGKSQIKNAKFLAEKQFSYDQVPFNFTHTNDGSFAFIIKNELNYEICIANKNLTIIKSIKLPENVTDIRYLATVPQTNSQQNDYETTTEFTLSWTQKNSLPRYGKLNLNTKEFTFLDDDVSGGIFYPIEKDNNLIYIANLFREKKTPYSQV